MASKTLFIGCLLGGVRHFSVCLELFVVVIAIYFILKNTSPMWTFSQGSELSLGGLSTASLVGSAALQGSVPGQAFTYSGPSLTIASQRQLTGTLAGQTLNVAGTAVAVPTGLQLPGTGNNTNSTALDIGVRSSSPHPLSYWHWPLCHLANNCFFFVMKVCRRGDLGDSGVHKAVKASTYCLQWQQGFLCGNLSV